MLSTRLFARLTITEEPRRPAIAKSALRGYKIDYVLSNQKTADFYIVCWSSMRTAAVMRESRWDFGSHTAARQFSEVLYKLVPWECELICVCARSNLLDKRHARQRREHVCGASHMYAAAARCIGFWTMNRRKLWLRVCVYARRRAIGRKQRSSCKRR